MRAEDDDDRVVRLSALLEVAQRRAEPAVLEPQRVALLIADEARVVVHDVDQQATLVLEGEGEVVEVAMCGSLAVPVQPALWRQVGQELDLGRAQVGNCAAGRSVDG